MPHHFYYLRGALGEPALVEEHAQVIKRVLEGEYTEKNIEKLKGPKNIYSLRLGDAARLLFTTIEFEQLTYMLVLEYLPNHEYEKSRFLRSELCLEKYTKAALSSIDIEALDLKISQEFLGTLDFSDEHAPRNMVVDYYQDQYLHLNETQQAVLQVRFPALLSGGAGSGKSCVGIALLNQYQLNYPTRRLLYVTRSPYLVKERLEDWSLLLGSSHVEFKTYEMLAKEQLRMLENDTWEIVDKGFFEVWFNSYSAHQKKISKSKGERYVPFDRDELYEEFRICSGYSEKDYSELGSSQGLIEAKRRAEILASLENYLAYLESNQKVDLSFYILRPEVLGQYALVVVDEAQDFSHMQAKQMFALAEHGQVLYCLDGHQRLEDRRSIIPYLRTVFSIGDERCIVLPQTYRCAPAITAIANEILDIKHVLQDGKVNKRDLAHLDPSLEKMTHAGSVHLISPMEFVKVKWSLSLADHANFVVVTYPEHKEEVKKMLGVHDGMIFTPSEIKGLESDMVLVWKLCQSDVLKTVRYELLRLEQHTVPRKGIGEIDDKWLLYFHELYVSVTRAKTCLIICDDITHLNEILLTRFTPHSTPIPQTLMITPSTTEDWFAQIKKFLVRGHDERARSIFLQKKFGNEAAFLDYCKSLTAPSEKEKLLTKTQTATLNEAASAAEASSLLVVTTIEQEFALKLYQEFSVQILRDAFRESDLVKLFRLNHLVEGGRRLCLIEFIQQSEERTNLFFASIVNYPDLFCQPNIVDALKLQGLSFKMHKSFKLKHEALNFLIRTSHQAIIGYFKKQLLGLILHKGACLYDIAIDLNLHQLIPVIATLGGNLNHFDRQGITPLIRVIAIQERVLVDFFIEKGADVNLGNFECETPLHFAAQTGNLAIMKKLVQHGANLNRLTIKGDAVMHFAAANGRVEVMDYLVSMGESLNVENRLGVNLLHVAAENGHLNVIDYLHTHHFDLSKICRQGYSAPHLAAQYGRLAALIKLSILGVNLNVSNDVGITPLFVAATNGDYKVVRFLLVRDFEHVPVVFSADKVPIFFKKCVSELISHGKHYLVPTGDGKSEIRLFPRDIAEILGHDDIVYLIESHLAKKRQTALSQHTVFEAVAQKVLSQSPTPKP